MLQNNNQILVEAVRPERQWKKRVISCVMMVMIALTGTLTPMVAEAKGHHHKHHHKHKHKHHHHHHYHRKKVVIVKERPRHHHHHHHYHKSRLPEIATFAVIAGITYAIIDNQYYKRRGDNYEYVVKPR